MEIGYGKRVDRTLTDAEFERLWAQQFGGFTVKRPDGSYQGKTDFAHMMYTVSAGCVDENAKSVDNSYPNAPVTWKYGKFWEDSDTRKQYTGWLGDAAWTGKNNTGTSFGPDDYTADLDADNIRRRMESQNISYIQASKDYYEDLNNNPQQRTQEFKQNNSYNSVKKAVMDAAGVKNMNELKDKDGWSDSYDFLKSLENDD